MLRVRFIGIFAWLLLSLCAGNAFGQSWLVSGTIADSLTKEPLAFVSIIVNNSNYGGRSDIDGKFVINSPVNPTFLNVSYLGYKATVLPLNARTTGLQILLAPMHYELSGVVILPGENPAHRIIRKVIENRPQNDPEKIASFQCQTYNKITAAWLPGENYYNALERWKTDSTKVDSTIIKLLASADQQHLLMMESYTRRIFMSPDRSKETVLATRVSGFKDPSFAPLATDVQPFSFYENTINLNTGTVIGYQNPLGQGAIGRYSYVLEDTLYDGNDSIYVIAYHPLQGKTFNGLKGVAYINTHGYAIQYIIAEPADAGLWRIRVQQQYSLIDGKQWFPQQLNYEWILPKYPNDKIGLQLTGSSYIENVILYPPLKARDFGPDQLLLSDSAGKRDSNAWSQYRVDPLDRKEVKTYTYMDSLGKRMNFDYYTRAMPAVVEGYIPIGPLDLAFDKLYNSNASEGNRVGLGLRTGEKISKWFNLGGYFGYGFKDKTWKYGGDLLFRLWRKKDLEVFGKYTYDVDEPGLSNIKGFRNSGYWYGMIGKQFDFTETIETGLRFRSFKFLETELSLRQSFVTPRYDYYYEPTAGSFDTTFMFAEVQAAFKYTVKDEITQAFGKRFSGNTRYPVLYASFTQGLSGTLRGEYPYSKLEVALSQNFFIRNLGKTSLLAEAGTLWGEVPYPRLFRAKGSYGGDVSFFLPNSFQTMRTGEFASDRYVSLFFRHNFGNFLMKGKKFKPEFIIAHNLIFGTLNNTVKHHNLALQAPSKGFYEVGLIIDNLFRVKLLNIAYLGIGGGAFYRYGSYAFDAPIKNLTGKISFRITGI